MLLKNGNVERIVESEAQSDRLRKLGYVELNQEEPKEPKVLGSQEPGDLSGLKVDQLKALAKERGIKGADGLKKEELLEVLKDVTPNE